MVNEEFLYNVDFMVTFYFMRCIDVRKGIFNNHLTTLWQSMQSCPEESYSITIYQPDHRRLGV